jgi:phosphoglycerate kinase
MPKAKQLRRVADAPVAGKRVLLRVDFNVPLQDGKVADDTRIKAALPTIELLHERGAAAILLITHVGRPGGKAVEALRTAPIAAALRKLTRVPLQVMENVRFDPREEAGEDSLARELAAQGDIFVNDAFADAHRPHASIVGLPKLLPSFAGLLMEKEVVELSSALSPPEGALAIIGGAKFETKEPLLRALVKVYGRILVGGALADDVLKARGFPIGASLTSATPTSPQLAGDERLVVPLDAVVREGELPAERTALISDIRATERMVDIGPHTMTAWASEVMRAPLLLWNGPMGVYEEGFTEGTDVIARAVSAMWGRAIVGGGDTEAAISKFSFDPARVFVSTGGGAMLQFLAEGTLPGLEPLCER